MGSISDSKSSMSAGLLVLFWFLPVVAALPIHGPILSPPTLQPLPFLFTLLPFPILATLKYLYLRFRRGQSIHAVPHSLQPSSFFLALNPYLVGIFGSPHWETTISCRIHASFSRSAHYLPPIPLSLHPHFSQSDKSTTNTSTLVSSFSRKSTSIPYPVSRPSLPQSSLSSPPRVPPSIRVPSSLSPTLMQIMAPVLNSSYDQSSATFILPRPSIHPNDHPNRFSTSTIHSSLLFPTSLTASPPPVVPLILLPKPQPPSPTFSIQSISPSPASVSLAVFHSPLASRIPVPKPVYTPSLRPESCVVLPRDWPTGQDVALLDSGPLSYSSTAFNTYNAVDPSLLPTRPLAILKSPRQLAHSSSSLGGSFVSPRLEQAISHSSTCRTPSPALSFFRSPQYQDWELADLHDLDGRLDIDAISRALGLGLGLGLPGAASISNYDSDCSEQASSSHSGSAVESESEDASDLDLPLDERPHPGSDIKSPGWDSRDGDLATYLGISVQMHVHGQPLSVIPEETGSEMGLSINEGDEDVLAGPDFSVADSCDEKTDAGAPRSYARSASVVWDGSWREGEPVASRLSVGVAC